MSGTKWTPDQLELLRSQWDRHTAEWIGRRVGRSKASVLQKAALIGLRKARPRGWWRGEFLLFLQEHVQSGLLDGEIAARWNAEPDRVQLDRRTVLYYRRAAGVHDTPLQVERRRTIKQAAQRRQLEVMGVRSFPDIYRRRVRRDAASAGWPLDCSRFEVAVLNLLANGRQWTRREISAALGRHVADQRDLLQTGKGSGSVLANLIARRLVAKSSGRPVTGRGKGHSVSCYWLTDYARDFHARATRRRCE